VLDVVVRVAVPLVRFPVPNDVVPLKKVTVPLGTPDPEVTVAVRAALAPIAIDAEARLKVVVVGIAFTVTETAALVEAA
jgi:hypothetical protein